MHAFRALCEQLHLNGAQKNGHDDNDGHILVKLSQLMRQSHESLKTFYECSHPDLDKLIEISDECGIGARLTGAG